jgi:hypothetical protein
MLPVCPAALPWACSRPWTCGPDAAALLCDTSHLAISVSPPSIHLLHISTALLFILCLHTMCAAASPFPLVKLRVIRAASAHIWGASAAP